MDTEFVLDAIMVASAIGSWLWLILRSYEYLYITKEWQEDKR